MFSKRSLENIHQYKDLIQLFEQTFYQEYKTKLVKGESEPIYLPVCSNGEFAQIVFAHGFYASALHEVAHWCIAGEKRRKLEDFGYWYEPDGRNHEQQKTFENVEIKPQAIEWAFCIAAGKSFTVSADNLNGVDSDTAAFEIAVYQQVCQYIHHGFPARAQQFIETLATFYRTELPLTIQHFKGKAINYPFSEEVTNANI